MAVKFGIVKTLSHFFSHFRYPASLPEDVALDLGVDLPRAPTFCKFIEALSSPHLYSKKLYKLMSKEEVERAFSRALKRENFRSTTLFSYFFTEGWLVLTLYFDENKKLQRLYVQCPSGLGIKEGFDISLCPKYYSENFLVPSHF